MTGKQLPPDTGREISSLKRRVSDLERMLDRVRRTVHRPVTPDPLSFAAYRGSGFDAGGLHTVAASWRHYAPANTIDGTVVDPTRHIAIDADTFGPWTLRVDLAGIYAFGVTVTFDDTAIADGDRRLAVQQVDHDGIVSTIDILQVSAAGSSATTLSGVAVTPAAAGSYWWAMYGENFGTPVAGSVSTYWALRLSTGPVIPTYVGSV